MSSFENFVQCRLVTPLSASAPEIGLFDAVAPYRLPPEDGGVVVLTDSPNRPSVFEVIRYEYRSGLALYGVIRGQEGTAQREWTGAAYCYQTLTSEEYMAALAGKEPVIAAGTSSQLWLGNKTWASVLSQVQGTLLTGLSLATGTAITAADTVLSGLGKLQKQISDAASNLAANVRATVITGYVVGSNTALAATDTLLAALGKIQGQLNGKQASLGYTAENQANKGMANGYASLDSGGKVPAVQLPSFVDDVLEYASLAGFPSTGEAGKIYVDLATNKTHRWSGSAYVEISASPGSTDAVTEGSGNLYFTEARVRSTDLAGLSLATGTAITSADTVLSGLGKLQKQISDAASNLAANVRATVITGYVVGSNTALAATDTLLAALGKIQGQLNGKLPLVGGVVTGNLSVHTGIDGGYGVGNGSGDNWGACIWGIGPSYDGTGQGTTYAVTSLYGVSWLRATHGSADAQVGEGLYVYQNGAFKGGIGSVGIKTAGVFYGNGSGLTSLNASNLASGTVPDARLSGTYTGVSITGNAATATTLGGLTATIAELNYMDGVTSNVQTQLNAKAASSHTHGYWTPDTPISGWYRSTGAVGWYNNTYGGGIHMSDTTWVRVYGSKAFYVANSIAATGNITAYYSDERLKENIRPIVNALGAVGSLRGVRYNANALAETFGYDRNKAEVGLLAQDVQSVMPEAVERAPFDIDGETGGSLTGDDYLTLKYERLVPLLVEAIKELRQEVAELRAQVGGA